MKHAKHRSFILTLNNPLISLDEAKETALALGAQSFVGQLESGESGTPHLQFCFQFSNSRAFSSIKQAYPLAHIEPCASYPLSAEYCQKTETRISGPVVHNPPKKRETKLATKERNQLILENGPEYAVAQGLVPVTQYERLVRSTNLYQLRTQKPDELPELDNHWFVGPSGSGKSLAARRLCPNAYVKLPNKWWDGY